MFVEFQLSINSLMPNIFAFSSSVFCLFTKNFCILFVFTWDRYLVRNIFRDFADASTARMKQESVTEPTAHYSRPSRVSSNFWSIIVKRNYFFFNQSHSGRSSSSSIIIGFKQILIFISANKFHYSRYTIKLLIFFNHL